MYAEIDHWSLSLWHLTTPAIHLRVKAEASSSILQKPICLGNLSEMLLFQPAFSPLPFPLPFFLTASTFLPVLATWSSVSPRSLCACLLLLHPSASILTRTLNAAAWRASAAAPREGAGRPALPRALGSSACFPSCLLQFPS